MFYPGGWSCLGGSRGMGGGCSCTQRDPEGWEGMFLPPEGWEGMFLHPEGSRGMGGDIPASHSSIPHSNIRNGPGDPGFDPPNLCGTQIPRAGCLLPKPVHAIPDGRLQDPKEPRTAPSHAFLFQCGFLTPWNCSAPLQVKVPALWVTLWSVQQPQEIFHP